MSSNSSETPITVIGAIIANFIIAVAKFVAAVFTGSSSMLSEGIHSLADTGNQGLLLLGINLSKRPADETHPFGYGKELYFWSVIVAIILFGIGGGLSIYEGITHLQHPEELRDPLWNYVVLGVAMIAEGTSLGIAINEFFKHEKEPQEGVWEAIVESKDPTLFVVLFEDSAAVTGLILAFLGVFLSHRFTNPLFDGLASIAIGIVLATVAIFLAYQSRELLLGERADPATIDSIQAIAQQNSNVQSISNILTMHFGPNQVLLTMDVRFKAGLSGDEIANTMDDLETNIRKKHKKVDRIFIEAESIRDLKKSQAVKDSQP
jgi:cation diffusion facilitator family transporter